MTPLGWTFDKARDVYRIERAERANSYNHAQTLLQGVEPKGSTAMANDFCAAAEQALRDNDCKAPKEAPGEGCRGDFLSKRCKATHSQRI